MSDDGHIGLPPTRGKLLKLTAIAASVGVILTVVVVAPAEWRLDPTGFGRMTGLSRLAGVKEVPIEAKAANGAAAAHFSATPWRTDIVDIPLAADAFPPEGNEVEWKVRMKAGDTVVYSWTVSGVKDGEEFYSDFHGHTPPKPEVQVATYRQSNGLANHGALMAPFDGVHGWYFQNSALTPAVVHLKLAGYYSLVSAEELKRLGAIADD